MTKYSLAILSALLVLNGYSQNKEIIVQLEEDYTNPKPMMWKAGTKHFGREIKDGMYVGKALSVLGPELTFPSVINQLHCTYLYDAEFTFVKLKGDKKGFMGIEMTLWYRGEDYYENFRKGRIDYKAQILQYIYFKYNEVGNWQLIVGNKNSEGAPIKSGTASVNEKTNKLKIMHQKNKAEFYLNDAKICVWASDKSWQSEWNELKLFADSDKFKIGIDQVKFTGYFDKDNRGVLLDNIYGLNARQIRYKDAFAVKGFDAKRFRLMDNRGRTYPEEYDEIETNASPGKLIKVKRDGLYGYITNTGTVIFPCEFTEASRDYCTRTDKDCRIDFYVVKDKNNKMFFVNEKAIKISASDADSKALFFAALDPWNEETVKSLLANGANINAYSEHGQTALHILMGSNNELAKIKFLVANGADVNARHEKSWTSVIASAIHKGNIETVKYLISKGADVNKLNGLRSIPALYDAISSKRVETVKLIVENGAEIKTVSYWSMEKRTPVEYAKEYGNAEIVAYLISKGAK